MDSAMWIAIITGATAILSGWVVSLGNSRTARIQADAAVKAQERAQQREARRVAHLEFLEHASTTGELYFRLGDVYMQMPEEEQLLGIQELRSSLRDAYDPLARSTRVILLQGPRTVGERAEAVRLAVFDANRALWHVQQGSPDATSTFDRARQVFRDQLQSFIDTAQDTADLPP